MERERERENSRASFTTIDLSSLLFSITTIWQPTLSEYRPSYDEVAINYREDEFISIKWKKLLIYGVNLLSAFNEQYYTIKIY